VVWERFWGYWQGSDTGLSGFQSQTTPGRIGLTVLILVPLSFFMGMPFGIGLKLANREHKHLTPWFWAINGAVSVLASVLAVIVAISRGIHMTLVLGIISYAVAFAALMLRKPGR
jgi:O-antigen/teichoic acid export membrane protein